MGVGKKLKAARTKAGLTQAQLAIASKVSIRTIQKIEREATETVTARVLSKLAKALGVSMEAML
jgi:transcriptional regulator with XRE-family HTH domain